jgi:hypothetical protein
VKEGGAAFLDILRIWLDVIENRAEDRRAEACVSVSGGVAEAGGICIDPIVGGREGSFRPIGKPRCRKVASLRFRNCHRFFTVG